MESPKAWVGCGERRLKQGLLSRNSGLRSWRACGIPNSGLHSWRACGIPISGLRSWRARGIPNSGLRSWRACGIPLELEAARAGFLEEMAERSKYLNFPRASVGIQ